MVSRKRLKLRLMTLRRRNRLQREHAKVFVKLCVAANQRCTHLWNRCVQLEEEKKKRHELAIRRIETEARQHQAWGEKCKLIEHANDFLRDEVGRLQADVHNDESRARLQRWAERCQELDNANNCLRDQVARMQADRDLLDNANKCLRDQVARMQADRDHGVDDESSPRSTTSAWLSG